MYFGSVAGSVLQNTWFLTALEDMIWLDSGAYEGHANAQRGNAGGVINEHKPNKEVDGTSPPQYLVTACGRVS